MHLLMTLLFMASFSLAEEDIRSVFDQHHEYMVGLVPSTTPLDPVMENFGLPGMYQDFKIELAGGSFQCFYQHMQKDAKMMVFFEVLKGSDKNINVEIIQPSGIALKSFQWINEGELDSVVHEDGIYTVCLDNRLSHFSSKVVSLYMHTYFEEHWEKMHLNMQESFESLSKSLVSFGVIDGHMKTVMNQTRRDGRHIIRDWYLNKSNNRFVQNASIFLCILIVVVSFLQAIFVKKLFSTTTAKPRIFRFCFM